MRSRKPDHVRQRRHAGAVMGVIALKFTDPAVERRTYIDAMAATIIDKTDGSFNDDKAVDILRDYGYENRAIAKYYKDANRKAKNEVASYRRIANAPTG